MKSMVSSIGGEGSIRASDASLRTFGGRDLITEDLGDQKGPYD